MSVRDGWRLQLLWGETEWNELSQRILGCCLAVHQELGPGLLESVYGDSLAVELAMQGLRFVRELPVAVKYRGRPVGDPLRLDYLVEDTIVLEVKAVEQFHRIHTAQVLTYLKLTEKPVGLLVNFNVPMLKEGIKRLMLMPTTLPASP